MVIHKIVDEFFCIYKMYLLSAERYINAGIRFLKINKTDEIWASMKNSGRGLGVTNISDLVLKTNVVFMRKKINKKRN